MKSNVTSAIFITYSKCRCHHLRFEHLHHSPTTTTIIITILSPSPPSPPQPPPPRQRRRQQQQQYIKTTTTTNNNNTTNATTDYLEQDCILPVNYGALACGRPLLVLRWAFKTLTLELVCETTMTYTMVRIFKGIA